MSKKTKQAAATAAPTGVVVEDAGTAAQEVATAQETPAPAGLYGSSVQPAVLSIGGKEIQLGTIVAAAHVASELSVDDWNALAVEVREELIAAEIAELESAEAEQAKAAEAAAAEAAAAEAAAAEAAAPAADFPRQVTLRNNGGFDVTDPATGAFIGGGSSRIVTVHDRAQAVLLLQNALAIKTRTGGRQSLQVHGLDDVEIPDGDAA